MAEPSHNGGPSRRPRTALVVDGRSAPALEVVRSLGRGGWRVLAPAGTRSGSSRFTARPVVVPEIADPEAFAAAVGGVLDQEEIGLLVPCSDASAQVFWERFERVPILGGDRTSFELASDKAATLASAEAAGFPVPRWSAPRDLAEAQRFARTLELPLVVKPRRSFAARAGRLVQRRHRFVRRLNELEGVLGGLAEPDGHLPLLQEYVPGRALATTAVLRGGRVIAMAARETLSFEPIAGGTSVWKRTIRPDDCGVAEACRLLVDIGFEGLAEVEYQVGADGVPRLMEIGARVHGWIGLAVAAGVDIPLIAASALTGGEVPRSAYRVGVEMRWPRGELIRIRSALDPRVELPPGVSRLGVVGRSWPPWRPEMTFDGVDRTDLVPLLPHALRARAERRRHPALGRGSGIRAGPALVYPLKAGLTRARSLAWLVGSRGEAEREAGLRLLFYHRVADDRDELAVTPERFRRQMELLATEGYRVLDVVEAVDLLLAGRLPSRVIGLSFDDGFRDVAQAALPVLREHGFRATVFVPTGVIDGQASFSWYESQPPVLAWDEICELDRAGTLRFEAHSVSHPSLPSLSSERAQAEVADSKAALESRLGRPVEAFCYPAGLFGPREQRLVREAGFRMATSCEPGLNRAGVDVFALRRQQVDARDGLLEFRAKLAGAHDSPLLIRTAYRRLLYGAGAGSPRAASSRV
jgi:peptidoglycan/xylan/chitin deacetylase (PgdA/CDA1 family)